MSGELNFTADIDLQQWRASIDRMQRDVLGLNQNVQSQTQQMDSAFKNLGVGIGAYFSVSALKGFAMELINVRGEFQKTEIAFTTMLGSADKSKALMAQMVDLAAKTPFGLEEVSNGAKQLLAFQVPANEVVDTLTRMGNIAAGLSVPLSRINLVYGQVKAKGKLMGDDLRQFTEAGIPMVAELAKKFGKTTGEIQTMVSAGKIGFKDVQDVLFSMTNEGGMFFNLMEKQSKSLSGQVANLGDAWDQMLNKIGESNEGILEGGISGLTYLVEHYQDVIDIITVLVATYGAYRAALIATVAVQNAATMAGNIQAFFQLATSIRSAKDAQILFNTVTKANPYVVAATALVALGTAIYVFANRTSEAEKAQQELNAEIAKQQAPLETTKTKIQSLVSAIKSENSTNAQRAEWLKQIKTLSNGRLNQLTIEQVRTGKAASAINDYIKQLYKEAEAKAYLQRITDLTEKRDELRNKTKSGLSAGDLWDDMTDVSTTHQGKDGRSLSTKQRRNLRIVNEINEISGEIQKARNKVSDITKQGVNISDVIPDTAASETEKKVKSVNKEVEKLFGSDTIKGLEQRLSKVNETISQTSLSSPNLSKLISQRDDLQKRLDEAQKRINKQSFEEQLSETKRQIEVRDKLIANGYSKEVVDSMFPEVKDKSYEKYLTDTELSLKKLIETGKGTEQTAKDLSLFTEELDKWKGHDSYIDSVSKSIDSLKSKYKGKELIGKLKIFGDSNLGNETENELNSKKLAVKNAVDDINEEWRKHYVSLLEEQKSYEEKSADLAKQYADAKDTDEYKNGSSADKLKVDQSFKKQQGTLDIGFIKDSKEWEAAFGEVELMTKDSLQRILDKLLEFKDKSKGTLSLQDTVELEKAIERVRSAANRNPFTNLIGSYNGYKDAIKKSVSAQKEVEQAQQDYNSTLDENGNKTDASAAAALKLAEAQKKGIQADIDAAAAKKKLIDNIQTSQNIFNAIGQGVMDLGDAFGGFDDATKDAIGNIMAIGNAAMDLGKSIASGDVAGMIKAGIQLITSVWKALNGDQKKERNIKKQAAQLKVLETAYNNLAYAAEKAFGSQKYSAQTDVIKNLEQQKQVLQGMINTESSKKKADKGKIAEWQNQIQSINQSIDQIKTKIVEDVLQTSVVDAAAKVGDALVDAFGRGESAVDSLNNAANEMIKNLLKNQLNLMLQKRMDPILKQLFDATGMKEDGSGSFTGLTPQQIADFKAQVQTAGADMQGFLDAYKDIFAGVDANAKSLEGAVKGVTEETASLIAGQMNAIRIVQAQMLQVSQLNQEVFRNQLLQLTQIEMNTRYTRDLYNVFNSLMGSLRAKGFI